MFRLRTGQSTLYKGDISIIVPATVCMWNTCIIVKMDRNGIIRIYFEMGLLYNDIVRILAVEHDIVLTTRHLKRILRSVGLARRNNYNEIGTSNDIHGACPTSLFALVHIQ